MHILRGEHLMQSRVQRPDIGVRLAEQGQSKASVAGAE